MVDWSAANQPSPAKPTRDSIHAALYGPEGLEKRYFRTRADCMDWVATLAEAAATQGERLLAGFDFPFGQPVGGAFAAAARPEALALWDHLARRVEDGPDNRSNRFDIAAELNAAFPGEGPFWGRPPKTEIPGLPAKKPPHRPEHPPEFRLCERRAQGAPGTNGRAQSVWKLYTAGSVGSQALLGMAALARLRARDELAGRIQVWPFETGFSTGDAPVVLAEIFPSLWATDIADAAEEAARSATHHNS